MGYLIRMVPEVEQWLAGVRDRDPAVAGLVEEAVAALRVGGESLGPPLVVSLEDLVPNSRPDLDTAYERQLQMLTRVRRAVADMATSRKRLELQAGQLEQQASKLDEQGRRAAGEGRADLAEAAEEQLAGVCREHAELLAEEELITAASQRLQARVDAFRIRKEVIKVAHTADAAAEAAWAEAVISDVSAEVASAGPAVPGAANADPPAPDRGPLWLSELRPGAPDPAGPRILFTVDPPDTAVLLTAGTEIDWLRAWYTEAVASCRLRLEREQQEPPDR
jgi:phage shock protein A